MNLNKVFKIKKNQYNYNLEETFKDFTTELNSIIASGKVSNTQSLKGMKKIIDTTIDLAIEISESANIKLINQERKK